MAAAPAVPEQHVPDGEEEEEYESDDYDVEDDEADADYQGEDADEEEDDEEEEGDEEERGQSLTALLVADPNQPVPGDEDDDEGYAPPGVKDPADEPVDGNARSPVGDTSEAKDTNSTAPAVGLKRKTSGDEDDEEDNDDEEESDAKKIKA